MRVYVCYCGDCDNLAFQQPGSRFFIAEDALGRDWLCVETPLPEIPEGFPDSAAEVFNAQLLASKHGLREEGTQHIVSLCPDETSLHRRIVEDTYPPRAESEARLLQAGWMLQYSEYRTGELHKLIVTNGLKSVAVEGRTENEAWYRAALKVLEPLPELHREGANVSLNIYPTSPPIRTDEYGVARVGNSQVLLDVVIQEFNRGTSPADIARAFSTLDLPEVYGAIAYYLRYRDEVDAYLQARREHAEKQRGEIEAVHPDRAQLKAKLLAQKAHKEQGHASVGN